MSLILLIDSVHAELAVALINTAPDRNTAVFKIHKEQRTHDKNLNNLVKELLNEQKTTFGGIDAYAVVTGPGSWTGCRVGVAAVKGFSAAHPCPVYALKSLDALGDPSAILSNLDKYYIKRGDKYTCETLPAGVECSASDSYDPSTDGYATLKSVGTENYRSRLISLIKTLKPITAKELQPFYITDFQVKS